MSTQDAEQLDKVLGDELAVLTADVHSFYGSAGLASEVARPAMSLSAEVAPAVEKPVANVDHYVTPEHLVHTQDSPLIEAARLYAGFSSAMSTIKTARSNASGEPHRG